ncbi:MAG: sulfotransferase [Planctomycetota bacterium]
MNHVEALPSSVAEEAFQEVRTSVRQSNVALVAAARKRLVHDRDDFAARRVLAADSFRRGDLDRGRGHLSRVLDRKPSCSLSNRMAGYAYLCERNWTAAEQHFRVANKAAPSDADTWTRLGEICMSRGDEDRAVQYFERGQLLACGNSECAVALARLYLRRGQVDQAISCVRSALRQNQRCPDLHEVVAKALLCRSARLRRCGNVVGRERALKAALHHWQVVVSVRPTSAGYLRLASVHLRRTDYAAAKLAADRAAVLNPGDPEVIALQASLNADDGNLGLASEQFREAFANERILPSAHMRYSRIKRFQPGSESETYIARLRRTLQRHSLKKPGRVSLLFALGKVFDDLGRYTEAWDCYEEANRLKAGHGKFVPPAQQDGGESKERCESDIRRERPQWRLHQSVRDRCQLFDSSYFETRQGGGHQSELPIFIVGMPRSGTTMTHQILASHGEVAGAGELQHVSEIRQQLACSLGIPASERTDSRILSDANAAQLNQMANTYLAFLEPHRSQHSRVADKMPTNFMYLGLIATLFPRATIVHCRRDPMDVIASCFSQNLAFPFCDLDAVAQYYLAYRKLMKHWEKTLPIKIHHVNYEEMVRRPEEQTRSLLDHCGLGFESNCLQFHRDKNAVRTPSKWQVRQPMYTSSVGKWKRFEAQLARIKDVIDDA